MLVKKTQAVTRVGFEPTTSCFLVQRVFLYFLFPFLQTEDSGAQMDFRYDEFGFRVDEEGKTKGETKLKFKKLEVVAVKCCWN